MAVKTPFYDRHVEYGAKLVDFAGYMMPISYSGINHEHSHVRQAVGVFDVSHMGEFLVSGKDSEDFIQGVTINDVRCLKNDQAQYSAMCYPDGGIVDDLIVYRFNKDKFMLVVNASNLDKDFQWLESHLIEGVVLKDQSPETALLAIQGPHAIKVLQKLTEIDLKSIDFYHFKEGILAGAHMIISRTGYTGEPGFELYHSPEDSQKLWEKLFEAGKEYNIEPVGLGARDTLRLEMKYSLYGNDIDKTTNPIEAGLGWICKLDTDDFIAKDVLLKKKADKPERRLIAFKMIDRGIPRHGYTVQVNGSDAGVVTSGSMSPTLGYGIGMAYVKREFSKIGSEISILVRNRPLKAEIVKPPFVDSTPMEF